MCEVCRSSLWCLLSFALVSRLAIHYHPFPSLPANFLSDLDVYNLHWPARYTPQANWGQSLNYDYESETDPYWYRPTSFAEIAAAMGRERARGPHGTPTRW